VGPWIPRASRRVEFGAALVPQRVTAFLRKLLWDNGRIAIHMLRSMWIPKS